MTLQALKTEAKNRGINSQFVRWFGGDLRRKQSWADAIEFVAVPADEVPAYEFVTWSDYVDVEPGPEPPEVAAIPTTDWRGKSWDQIIGVEPDVEPEMQKLDPKPESIPPELKQTDFYVEEQSNNGYNRFAKGTGYLMFFGVVSNKFCQQYKWSAYIYSIDKIDICLDLGRYGSGQYYIWGQPNFPDILKPFYFAVLNWLKKNVSIPIMEEKFPEIDWQAQGKKIIGAESDPEPQELDPKPEAMSLRQLKVFAKERDIDLPKASLYWKDSKVRAYLLDAFKRMESAPELEPKREPTPKFSDNKPPTVPISKQNDPVLTTFANSLLSKLSNWEVGDRVVRRECKAGSIYYGNHGTVMEVENQRLLVDWDWGYPRTAWIPVTSVIKGYISGPIDLPEPKDINLNSLEISPATSIQIATANGLYEHNYRGFDVWISYLHGSIIGGAICSKTKAWTFITGCLGPLKNCYPSDPIVRRWFSKVAHRIIEERLVESKVQQAIPFKLTFAFELYGNGFSCDINSQVPADSQRFDMWVGAMAGKVSSIVRSRVDSDFFHPQTWLLISLEGIEDRDLRSRILATVYYRFSSDDLGLIALKVDDDDFTVALTNDPNYELGDSVAIVPSGVA